MMLNFIMAMMGLAWQGALTPGVAIRSGCDAGSDVVAQIPLDAKLDVHFAIDNGPTCYRVTLSSAQGGTVRGYVLDRHIDAVIAFEKSRVRNEKNAFNAPLASAKVAEVPVEADKPQAAVAAKAQVEKKSVAKGPKLTW
jgi:hypothetical protein